MTTNNDLLAAAELLEAAAIGSVRLALAQSPHGPQRGRRLDDNLDAVAGVLDRHRHLQEASMTINLARAIYASEATKHTLAQPDPADHAGGEDRIAQRLARLARQLLANPSGTPMHRLGMELAAVAEGRP
ncbi:hypothetical protein [Nocardia terpenica]|uniref:Uncharacterized protein n=1 Tax=Nocardia terpenica TaxID=455432 RepID=A0A164H9Q0_9NOCA|nr:hypothetical protein [Nocardia terpenica]KZM68321.1 hypothetical protein AWN90_10535 [Nocardia terpenica]NQE88771.1 hypothetical protein [Nocardia terpenica]